MLLQSLDVSSNAISPKAADNLVIALNYMDNLETLNITDCDLGLDSFISICLKYLKAPVNKKIVLLAGGNNIGTKVSLLYNLVIIRVLIDWRGHSSLGTRCVFWTFLTIKWVVKHSEIYCQH